MESDRKSLSSYEAQVSYSLSIEALEPNYLVQLWKSASQFTFPKRISVSVPLSPFTVYDPKIIPYLIYPEPLQWRSAPGMKPLEYDIHVDNRVLGPSDQLSFNYRLHVNAQSARQGIRIKNVSMVLIEVHVMGEIIYTRRYPIDAHADSLGEIANRKVLKYSKCQAPIEILRWDNYEILPTSSSDGTLFELEEMGNFDLSLLKNSSKQSGGDGIYAENQIEITLPSRGGFLPSTFKYDPDSHYCYFKKWPHVKSSFSDPLFEIRHFIQFRVDLDKSDPVKLEAPVILCGVNTNDCLKLLDESTDMMPALDYEKVVGKDVWVPTYTAKDPLLHNEWEAL